MIADVMRDMNTGRKKTGLKAPSFFIFLYKTCP